MKKIKKQIFRKVDFVIVGLTILAIIGLIGYARPLVIAPIDNLSTTENLILFSFDKGSYIILDDNDKFSSPERIYAQNNLVLNLKPGVYYWKVEGALNSEIRKLTIHSKVGLKLIENKEGYDVINDGNVALNVSVYNKSVLTGNVIAEVEEAVSVFGDEYFGREYEKD